MEGFPDPAGKRIACRPRLRAQSLDHRRLQWSKWFRSCESSFSVLLAPCQPGIFALGEEIVSGGAGSKRMLALFISRNLVT